MFGQNPLRKAESNPDELQVRNIFYTLQGEGPFAGRSSVFIRLTGCNLACAYCDTQWDDAKDPRRPVEDIALEAIHKQGQAQIAVLTGGEPLRQNLSGLIPLLLTHFEIVQLETAGTYWQDCLDLPRVFTVVSPKTPRVNKRTAERACAFKYVIQAGQLDPDDGLPVTATQAGARIARLARPPADMPIYLSPCDEYDEAKNAANRKAIVESALTHGYIAGVQMHKVLDVE